MDRTIAWGIALVVLLIVCLIFGFVSVIRDQSTQHKAEMENLNAELTRYKKSQNTSQRAVIKGHLAEQVYPLLTEQCPYNLSDMRFMGMPIDYLIFDGYTECKDANGDIREIVFADVKSGSAQLTKTQRSIKRAVEEGRVRWETINLL